MTLTTHAAIGAAIGTVVGNPLLGFTLGAASHFLVDMIPHGDNDLLDSYQLKKEKSLPVAFVSADYSITLLLVMILVAIRPDGISNSTFAASIIGSILPDLLVGAADMFKKNKALKAYRKFHFFFHDFFSRRYGDTRLSYALAAQLGFIIVLLHSVFF